MIGSEVNMLCGSVLYPVLYLYVRNIFLPLFRVLSIALSCLFHDNGIIV